MILIPSFRVPCAINRIKIPAYVLDTQESIYRFLICVLFKNSTSYKIFALFMNENMYA